MWYILLGFLAFLLYKLVFGLIIPVVRATRRVRKQFREFEQQMNNNQGFGEAGYSQTPKKEEKKSNTDRDYIEFEEINFPGK